MNYSPKHGGGQKTTDRTADSGSGRRSPGRSSADKKSKSKALVIILLVIFSAAVIVALVFLLKPAVAPEDAPAADAAATQSSATTGSYTSPNPVLQYSGGEIPTSGSRHDVTVATDGGPDAMEVIGTWYVDDWTAYVFDGYGRGVMLTSNNNYTFAYSAQDGHLIIDYDTDNGMDTEYTYVFKDDNLILKRGNTEYQLTNKQ